MYEFNATDRCDRCGAQAKHIATKPGMELMLCGHHHKEFGPKLLEQYWLIDSDISPVEPVPVAAYTE